MSAYKPLSVIGDLAGAVEDAHRVEEDVVPEAHAGPVEQLDAGAGRARARQAVAAWALFIPHKISSTGKSREKIGKKPIFSDFSGWTFGQFSTSRHCFLIDLSCYAGKIHDFWPCNFLTYLWYGLFVVCFFLALYMLL